MDDHALTDVGWTFLCFEGAEKLLHIYLQSQHDKQAHHEQLAQAVANEEINLLEFEKEKSKALFALTLFCLPKSS